MKLLAIKKRIIIFSALMLLTISMIFIELNLRFPKNIKLYPGESLKEEDALLYSVDIPAGTLGILEDSGVLKKDSITKNDFSVNVRLFGIIPVKTVNVSIEDEQNVCVSGKTIGIKLFADGLVCVGISDIMSSDGRFYNVGSLYDIRPGDIILSANGTSINTTEAFSEIITNSGENPIVLNILRGKRETKKQVFPIPTDDGLKLGLWVRDSTAGIGTLTFYSSKDNSFGALGHPILDADTGVLMPASKGEITKASVIGVDKGEKGIPGELKGLFKNANSPIGEIDKNTEQGIYGKIYEDFPYTTDNVYPVASRNVIKEGNATILSNINGENVEEFDISIKRVMKYNVDSFKDMVIEVTDSDLIEKTGGIVQGMSGSPILQNGKIVGAVTHVFVNDPTKGYGIFIENMLAEAEKK